MTMTNQPIVPAGAMGLEPDDDGVPLLPPLDFIRGYVGAQGQVLGPEVADELRCWVLLLIGEVAHLRQVMASAPAVPRRTTGVELTSQEARVYRYLRNTSMDQVQIARTMNVSINTLKTHAKHVYRKLGVQRRAELRDHDVL